MGYDSLVISVRTGLVALVLFSLPSIAHIIRQFRRRDPKEDLYEDGDGKSTAEAMKAYSAKLSKTAILLFALAGFATSLAITVLVILRAGRDGLSLEDWLCSGAWVNGKALGFGGRTADMSF